MKFDKVIVVGELENVDLTKKLLVCSMRWRNSIRGSDGDSGEETTSGCRR